MAGACGPKELPTHKGMTPSRTGNDLQCVEGEVLVAATEATKLSALAGCEYHTILHDSYIYPRPSIQST